MNELIKFLGVVLILIGVVIFVVYSQTMGAGNGYLVAGSVFVLVGLIAHILINKYLK